MSLVLASLLLGTIFVTPFTLGRIAYAQVADDSVSSSSTNSTSTSSPPSTNSTSTADTGSQQTPSSSGNQAPSNSSPIDSTVTLEHSAIEINNPVEWVQTVTLSNETAKVAVEIPADAENVSVVTSGGQEVSQSALAEIPATTGNVTADGTPVVSLDDVSSSVQENATTKLVSIDQPAAGYDVAFETPAPYTIENEHSTSDTYQKDVTVTHDSAFHYTDVKSYSSIPESLVSRGTEFKLYWMVDGVKTDVTSDPRFAVTFVDTDGNGIADQMQWVIPQLSEQQFVIEGVILTTAAEHLDANRNFVADVYNQTKSIDGILTDPIPAGEYIRATFEQHLDSSKSIEIYATSAGSNSSVQLYEKDSNVLIGSWQNITQNRLYELQLANYAGYSDRFDLKVAGEPVQFDYIQDAGSVTLTPASGPVGTSVQAASGGGVFTHNCASCITVKYDGSTVGTGRTNNGGNISPAVTFTVPSSSIGAHTVSASDGTTTLSATFTVTQGSTTTAVTSPANPSVFGQSVTFTATVTAVAPATLSPTGTVTFKDGATTIGTGSLSASSPFTASISTASLSVATHSITAVYGGDANFSTSTSSALSQVVNKANTTASTATSGTPSVFGQSVTFTATINITSPGSGILTGTITFKDGANTLGSSSVAGTGPFTAAFSTSTLTVGSHGITATYSGDGNFNASPASPALTQIVNQASTSTSLSSSANPSIFGQSVTFAATVSTIALGSGTPSGTVTFKDGVTTLGTGALSSGQATFSTSALSVGPHGITAEYGADTNFATSTSSVLTQTVNSANTAPVAAGDSYSTAEDTSLNIAAPGVLGNDADAQSDPLTASLVSGPLHGSLTLNNDGSFSYSPDPDFNGADSFTYKASDGSLESNIATVSLTVNPVNDDPVVDAGNNVAADEGMPVSLDSASFADVDGVSDGPFAVSINWGDDSVHTTQTVASPTNIIASHTYADNGAYLITIKVTDKDGDVGMGTTTATIANVDPTVNAGSDATINEGDTFGQSGSFADPGSDSWTATVDYGDGSGVQALTLSGMSFSLSHTYADNGVYTVTVTVTDDDGGSSSDAVQVTANNVAPAVDAGANANIDEGSTFSQSGSFTDPGADTWTATADYDDGTGPHALSLSGSTFTLSHAYPTYGVHTVTVKVTDDDGGVGTATVQVTVNNVAPTLTVPSSAINIDEGSAASFTATAIDPGSPAETLSFSLIGAPAAATINSSSGAFSWTTGEADGPNTYTFSVKVSDGSLVDTKSVTVNVAEVNQAPSLTVPGPQTINECSALSFATSGADADLPANSLTYSLQDTIPTGASINPTTGAFTWTPSEAQGPGIYTITIRVTDNGSPAMYDQKTVSVTVNEVNQAPVLAVPASPQNVNEGSLISFSVSATDPDLPANTVTLGATGLPAGASFTAGTFSWTPSEAQGPGSYTVTFTATDNGSPAMSDTRTVTISVAEVNQNPVLAPIASPISVYVLSTATFTASATDADLPAQALTYSLVSPPAGASINPTTGAFTWTPSAGQGPASYTITVKATDSLGGSATQTVTINVQTITITGFYQPVDMDTTSGKVLNTAKAGSTVPLKFNLYRGGTSLNDVSNIQSFTSKTVTCSTDEIVAPLDFTTTGNTGLRWDATAGQFINNWKTPSKAGTCIDVTMTTIDGASILAHFKMT